MVDHVPESTSSLVAYAIRRGVPSADIERAVAALIERKSP